MPALSLDCLVSELISLSLEAGDLIRTVLRTMDLNVEMKGKDDPMTIADLISQRHIISAITSKWRELHIVAEEDLSKLKPFDKTAFPQPSSAATPERCGARQIAPEDVPETLRTLREQDLTVFIDPLDATFQFTQGNVEPVMVLIGVAMDKQPLAGVMYQPFVGEFGKLCWGIAPFGDFKGINSGLTRTEAKVPKSIEEVIFVSTFKDDETMRKIHSHFTPRQLIRAGGAGFKLKMLSEGRGDVYFSRICGTSKWDICAPEAILRSVGGCAFDFEGNPLVYNESEQTSNVKGVIAVRSTDVKNELVEFTRTLL